MERTRLPIAALVVMFAVILSGCDAISDVLGLGGAPEDEAVTAPGGPLTIDDLDEAGKFIGSIEPATEDKPGDVRVGGGGLEFPTDWPDLLRVIAEAGKFVKLDISEFAMASGTNNEFDPNAGDANDEEAVKGKALIVSLVLPKGAVKAKGSFKQNFTKLKSVSGEGVETIESGAFMQHPALTRVSFPAVKTIGNGAFYDCAPLSSASFPAATTIGDSAFQKCYGLTEANFPAATSVGNSAFSGCTSLTTANFLGEVTDGQEAIIGYSAFEGCTILTTANFPAATKINGQAFKGCTILSTAIFPAVTYIGYNVFEGCESLSSVDLRSAEIFWYNVFKYTGTEPLTVTLGSHAPDMYGGMFVGVTGPKTVTVEVPSSATGYGDIPATYESDEFRWVANWSNGFRGRGLVNGYDDSGPFNENIKLRVKYIGAPDETE
jgi:hypothetical protein